MGKIQNNLLEEIGSELSKKPAFKVTESHLLDTDDRGAVLRHDMMNCLCAMRLRLGIMKHMDILDEVQLKPLRETLARMEMLVQDWRSLSNIDKPPVNQLEFNLSEVVLNLVESSEPCALLKQQTFNVYIECATTLVKGDQSQIQRAIDNIISNAVKYTPDGGIVSVSMIVRDGIAIISVQDNGIGIPDDEQQHVFEPYYRAQNAVATDISGTGLGLYQVKEAVEQHGGTVWLRSKARLGTQIDIHLPVLTTPTVR